VLAPASLDDLARGCERFEPQIVHLIGHGRWDPEAAAGVLELRSDENRAHGAWASGPELVGALRRTTPPTVAVLSACETGVAYSDGGAPLAATLVAHGVPIVLAMAGDVADTACRVFSRAVAAAVSDGLPLTWAVCEGRRAAFRRGLADLHPLDWALPALFVAPELPAGFRLVDTARSRQVRAGVRDLGLNWAPVFCGRDEFFAALDRALDPDDSLAVIVAYNEVDAEYGGTRLLRELAAAALRAGHLPCLVGPFVPDLAPKTVRQLATKVTQRVLQLRKRLGVAADWSSETLAVLADQAAPPAAHGPGPLIAHLERVTGPDVAADLVVDAIRADLIQLAADCAAARPELFRPDARPLLLLDDVHLYDRALDALVDSEVLGPSGFGAGPRRLPVVLFGKQTVANGERLADAKARWAGAGWCQFHRVRHFRDIAASEGNDSDVLAYQWWLLNPEPALGGPAQVLAPQRTANNPWADVARLAMHDSRQLYSGERLAKFAAVALRNNWLTGSDDDAILRAFGIVR
jgi:hypothetical protein